MVRGAHCCLTPWPSGKVLSGAFNGIRGMPQNFIACDREQSFLLPPSLLEWVPEDHLVWTILGAVDELDLSAIFRIGLMVTVGRRMSRG